MVRHLAFAGICVVSLAGIAGITTLADEPGKKSPAVSAPFELIKKLNGEWTGRASHGDHEFESTVTYRLTSAGSAVIETLFGGTDHEMITMYHTDGNDLLLTHYCSAGNQPRMKAIRSDDSKKLEFKFLDGTNLDAAKDMHMHEMTLKFLDDDHIQAEWVMFVNGKATDQKAKFDLRRKKKAT